MEKLVRRLKAAHPTLTFVAGESFCWSPQTNHIFYSAKNGEAGLLHEVGHALLGHRQYSSDLELLLKEVEAWDKAFELGGMYDITIDRDHAEDCIDTYREWLHKRSRCPSCISTGVQESPQSYRCLNCRQTWQVTAARFCRPYRRSGTPKEAGIITPAS